jgi:hypothetical protein
MTAHRCLIDVPAADLDSMNKLCSRCSSFNRSADLSTYLLSEPLEPMFGSRTSPYLTVKIEDLLRAEAKRFGEEIGDSRTQRDGIANTGARNRNDPMRSHRRNTRVIVVARFRDVLSSSAEEGTGRASRAAWMGIERWLNDRD